MFDYYYLVEIRTHILALILLSVLGWEPVAFPLRYPA